MPIPKDNPLYNDITGAQTTQHRTDGQLIETDENGMPLPAATATPRENTPAAQKSGGTGVTGNTGMPGTSGTAGGTAAAGATVRAGHQPYGQFNGSSYQELEEFLREQMKAVKPETEEERKKREKREKVNGIISGISDMGRALANLYFTSQYAPNAYQGETMSDKYQARLDKAKAQRDKDLDRYYNYAMNLAKLKQGDQNFHFQQERAKATDEHNKAQQAYRDKQLDLYYQREERMQQEADRKERMADWQKEYQQGQLDLKKAQIELRKWIEQGKMSRAQINHNLASWKRTKRYILDDKGKKIGEEEERIVMNPDGTLTTESSIKYDDGQGGGSSQQGGRKANPMGGGQSGTGGKKKNPMG